MRVITLSIASLLSARSRRQAREEAGEDRAAGIPPAMLRHLLRQGLLYEFLIVLSPAPIVFILDQTVGRLLLGATSMDVGHYAICTFAVFVSSLLSRKSFGRGAVNLEIRYRDKHGKWRWER